MGRVLPEKYTGSGRKSDCRRVTESGGFFVAEKKGRIFLWKCGPAGGSGEGWERMVFSA
jgi:hypothetical protein